MTTRMRSSVSLTCTGDGDVDSSPKDATDEDNAIWGAGRVHGDWVRAW